MPTTENNDLVVGTNVPKLITTKITIPTISDSIIEEVINVVPSLDNSKSLSNISTFFISIRRII
jgi:hypothetical protein